ncbi:MAG: CPBP family intramembrane glutamic endopeptidase [Candidatus Anstonellaceae archaeon]
MQKHLALFALSALAFFILFPPWAPYSSSVYISLILLFLGLFLSNRDLKKAAIEFGILQPSNFQKAIFFGAIAYLLCFSAAIAISAIFSFFGILDSGKVMQKMEHFPVSVLVFSFTIAPFAEEVFFRGFLLLKLSQILKGKFSFFVASVGSSIVFSAMHISYGSIAQLAVAFVVGMILCASVRISGMLLPAIVAHAVFNFASVLLFLACKTGYCQF